MKAIINGFRYDTSKATMVGNYTHSHPGDFHYVDEDLYVTPRAHQYFLAGQGGAMSKYATAIDQNSWSGGSKISPLTKEQAYQWAETYLDADEIETAFTDMIKDA
jgi:hypothetical protein